MGTCPTSSPLICTVAPSTGQDTFTLTSLSLRCFSLPRADLMMWGGALAELIRNFSIYTAASVLRPMDSRVQPMLRSILKLEKSLAARWYLCRASAHIFLAVSANWLASLTSLLAPL